MKRTPRSQPGEDGRRISREEPQSTCRTERLAQDLHGDTVRPPRLGEQEGGRYICLQTQQARPSRTGDRRDAWFAEQRREAVRGRKRPSHPDPVTESGRQASRSALGEREHPKTVCLKQELGADVAQRGGMDAQGIERQHQTNQ